MRAGGRADGRTDGHNEKKVDFRNFANAPKNTQVLSHSVFKNGHLKDGTDMLSRNVRNPQQRSSRFLLHLKIPVFPPFDSATCNGRIICLTLVTAPFHSRVKAGDEIFLIKHRVKTQLQLNKY